MHCKLYHMYGAALNSERSVMINSVGTAWLAQKSLMLISVNVVACMLYRLCSALYQQLIRAIEGAIWDTDMYQPGQHVTAVDSLARRCCHTQDALCCEAYLRRSCKEDTFLWPHHALIPAASPYTDYAVISKQTRMSEELSYLEQRWTKGSTSFCDICQQGLPQCFYRVLVQQLLSPD